MKKPTENYYLFIGEDGKFDAKLYQVWYRKQNKEKSLVYHRERYKEIKDEITKRHKEHYQENRAVIIKKNKEYYAKTRLKRLEQKKQYVSCNRDRYNLKAKERYWLNPQKRIEASISSLIRRSIRDKNNRTWELLVGYDVNQLMQHLEKQFQEDMTWNNYGDWHIDHIKPRRKFNYQSCDEKEFKKCWALYNLRPLWREENIRRNYV